MNKKITVLFSVSALLTACCGTASVLGFANRFGWFTKEKQNAFIHISVDDTINIFKDLTESSTYKSIFDQPILRFQKKLHDEFGAKFSMYCFYEKDGFDLSQATDKYSEEFSSVSSWLRFGFHSFDDGHLDGIPQADFIHQVNLFYQELHRIVGFGSDDLFLRLGYYGGRKEQLEYLQTLGIKGFYSADDDRNSYYFDEDISKQISNSDSFTDQTNSLVFVPTFLRLESGDNVFWDLKSAHDRSSHNYLEIFTHEWTIEKKEVLYNLNETCEFARNYSYEFAYKEI